MKYTLLELTQDVLSSMDSDEVNSIFDTVESQQVATIIKTVYDDIMTRSGVDIGKNLFNLVASNDPLKPILMLKPDGVDRIEWVKYNCNFQGSSEPNWVELNYMPIQDFIDYTYQMDPSDGATESFTYTVDSSFFQFFYKNNVPPQYYTTFDDNTVIFDAYDNTVDSTLQSAKTLCYGPKKTTFVMEDDFVPNLQPGQFALLLNESKSLAWVELKQTTHEKAEQTARRNWRHIQKVRQNVAADNFDNGSHAFDRLPNFSRKR